MPASPEEQITSLSREEEALISNLEKERKKNETQLIFLAKGLDEEIAIREQELRHIESDPSPSVQARREQLISQIKDLKKLNVDAKSRNEAEFFWKRFTLANATRKALEEPLARLNKIKQDRIKSGRSVDEVTRIYNEMNILHMDSRDVVDVLRIVETYDDIYDAVEAIYDVLKDELALRLQQEIRKLVTELNADKEKFLREHSKKRFYSPAHFHLIHAVENYLEDLNKISGFPVGEQANKSQEALNVLNRKIAAIQQEENFKQIAEQFYSDLSYKEKFLVSLHPLYVFRTHIMKTKPNTIGLAEDLKQLATTTTDPDVSRQIRTAIATIQTEANNMYIAAKPKQSNALIKEAEKEVQSIKNLSQNLELQYQAEKKQYDRATAQRTYDPRQVVQKSKGGFIVEKFRNLQTNNEITLYFDQEGQLTQVVLPTPAGTIQKLKNALVSFNARQSDLKCLFDYLEDKEIRLNADWQVYLGGKKDKKYSAQVLKEMVQRGTAEYNLTTPQESKTTELAKERKQIQTQLGQIKKEKAQQNMKEMKKTLKKADEFKDYKVKKGEVVSQNEPSTVEQVNKNFKR